MSTTPLRARRARSLRRWRCVIEAVGVLLRSNDASLTGCEGGPSGYERADPFSGRRRGHGAIRLFSMPVPATADVVVVTYNPGATIASFLESIAKQAGVASIAVVDNASRDGAAAEAAQSAGVTFVDTGRNGGYGFGANRGAEVGTAPWILISNADIVVDDGALERLIEVGEADASIGIVGPHIRELDGSTYPSARPLPTFVLGTGHALFGRVWPSNPWTRRYRITLDPARGNVPAGWLSGACFLIRREAWERVGGFDEGFFMFFEDVDLGRRVGEAGYRSVWTPRAGVTHIGGHSYRSDPAPMLKAHHDSARRYVSQVYPHWWQAPIRAMVAAGLAMRQRSEIAAARSEAGTQAD